MDWLLLDFFSLFFFILLCFFLGLIVLFMPNVLILKDLELEKLSAYECGFDPFQDTRSNFDVQFYLVAMLFILFDIELIFLIPWIFALSYLNLFGLFVMFFFIFLLLLGFFF